MNRYVALASILAISLSCLAISCSGMQPTKTPQVTFDQLFADPARYNGKQIVIEGFYFHGFEVIVLCERLEYSGHAPGHLVPAGKMMWIEGGIPRDVFDQLYRQQMMGPTERYGKISITGKFQYGNKYGHVGAYQAQIVPSEALLLQWSPPTQQ
ncbi:MAG: hypothetical protein FJ008_03865 [Chloroflexi bacterium]|nr:hypothetical protein [Chloroflexota bacterium]MBM3165880.1 hypothetical protein [Chloroflexota bacterium]MBM4449258.1 hypothetical protein [Chloroflexota bacterium]